jgi:hypothetical protein
MKHQELYHPVQSDTDLENLSAISQVVIALTLLNSEREIPNP